MGLTHMQYAQTANREHELQFGMNPHSCISFLWMDGWAKRFSGQARRLDQPPASGREAPSRERGCPFPGEWPSFRPIPFAFFFAFLLLFFAFFCFFVAFFLLFFCFFPQFFAIFDTEVSQIEGPQFGSGTSPVGAPPPHLYLLPLPSPPFPSLPPSPPFPSLPLPSPPFPSLPLPSPPHPLNPSPSLSSFYPSLPFPPPTPPPPLPLAHRSLDCALWSSSLQTPLLKNCAMRMFWVKGGALGVSQISHCRTSCTPAPCNVCLATATT